MEGMEAHCGGRGGSHGTHLLGRYIVNGTPPLRLDESEDDEEVVPPPPFRSRESEEGLAGPLGCGGMARGLQQPEQM